ncbi:LysR family transcriptional regulator [Vibrio barjaei]|uniref:LysR family transcriptional regulator n=2 Tax=Vibrio TaxID=662 RepID=UPI002284F056|nr:LysR family transcriptional regulator [Vibrio barjaei]MCY9871158.1 LysR family transcriptional regulator [Vibrio barjaei]
MINLEYVNYFICAAELGSFSAAARKKKKALTTVSAAIANLEDQLGVKLFDRTMKYPELTPEGQRMYEIGVQLLRQAERMEVMAHSIINDIEEQLVIGMDELVPFSLIEPIIAKFEAKFPNTKLRQTRSTVNQLYRMLDTEEIDLAIHFANSFKNVSADYYHIANIEMVAVCSPDSHLSDSDAVNGEQLVETRQICSSGLMNNEMLNDFIVSNEVWEFASTDDVIRVVENDLGWAIVPKSIADERAQLGTLKVMNLENNFAKTTFMLDFKVNPSLSHGPALSYMVEQLKGIPNS